MRNRDYGTLGIVLGIAGVCYALYTSIKMEKMSENIEKVCNKIDKSIDDISDDIDIDLPQSIVNAAVDKAVEKEVTRQVSNASSLAIVSVRNDMAKQVKDAVSEAYDDIHKSVSDEVSKQVADIDMRKLTKSVREKAEDRIVSKFDGDLDDILEKYNDELRSVSRIYQSIADAMKRKDDCETILKIGGII